MNLLTLSYYTQLRILVKVVPIPRYQNTLSTCYAITMLLDASIQYCNIARQIYQQTMFLKMYFVSQSLNKNIFFKQIIRYVVAGGAPYVFGTV